jgi:hypothetical protein
MTIRVADDGSIMLIGDCAAEDADLLLSHLVASPEAMVNWGSCLSAHTSVIQVLLASGREPIGPPRDKFLETMIGPAFDRARR